MLDVLRNSIRFAILLAALAACFTAGRALAQSQLSSTPLILTSVAVDGVCGHPVKGDTKSTLCFPSANGSGKSNDEASSELTLTKPTDLFATSIASCALDGNAWKCWGLAAGVTPQALLPVFNSQGSIFAAGDNVCRADPSTGIVSCSLMDDMYNDPLILDSSRTPDVLGTYFGPFTKLKAFAGAKNYLCFVADDILQCASDGIRERIPVHKLKNATAVAIADSAVCVIDDQGLRCFNAIGENSNRARPSWKGAKKLASFGNDVCAILATDEVDCESLASGVAPSATISGNIPSGLGAVLDLGVGKNFACALKADRTIACWSNGSAVAYKPSGELSNVTKLSVAEAHACVLDANSEINCWGENESGQTEVLLRSDSPISKVASGNVACSWNKSGARCISTSTWGNVDDVVSKMPPLTDVLDITIDSYDGKTACAITKVATGTKATCWGAANSAIVNVPETVVNPKKIQLGEESACAITGDESLVCWGKTVPIPWNTHPKQIEQFELASDRLCLIDFYGFVCWGPKPGSELATPERFQGNGAVDILQFALGRAHTCVRTSSDVACWGENNEGQIQVPPLSNPISLMATDDTTCASDDSGVVCWGAGIGNLPP